MVINQFNMYCALFPQDVWEIMSVYKIYFVGNIVSLDVYNIYRPRFVNVNQDVAC